MESIQSVELDNDQTLRGCEGGFLLPIDSMLVEVEGGRGGGWRRSRF